MIFYSINKNLHTDYSEEYIFGIDKSQKVVLDYLSDDYDELHTTHPNIYDAYKQYTELLKDGFVIGNKEWIVSDAFKKLMDMKTK